MVDNRITQLGALLESKNRTIRNEAVEAFSGFSFIDAKVVEVLFSHLSSSSWEARISTAEAIGQVLRRLPSPIAPAKREPSYVLDEIDIPALIAHYKPLLSAGVSAVDSSASLRVSSKQQRQLIDQHLDLPAHVGLSSSGFLSEADVLPTTAKCDSPSYTQGYELSANGVKAEMKEAESERAESEAALQQADNAHIERLIVDFAWKLIRNIADVKWQDRHGAALALSKLIAIVPQRIPSWLWWWLPRRLLEVLTLDRFNDFVSGRSAAAPVRDACAQALAHWLADRVGGTGEGGAKEECTGRATVLRHVNTLVQLPGEKHWVCRQSGLLVLKYLLAVSDYSPHFEEMFSRVVAMLDDPVDDVVSSAVTALSSLFASARLSPSVRSGLMARVMHSVWRLIDKDTTIEQVRCGLDGLLIDLLCIVEAWLGADGEAILSPSQLRSVVDSLHPSFPVRTRRALHVLAAAIERRQHGLWTEKEVFHIVKVLYRVLLFAPPPPEVGGASVGGAGDNARLLDEVFLTAHRVIQLTGSVLAHSQLLRNTIGLWIGCLMFDHKTPMIDVYAHCVDGVGSNADDGCEKMCSEEMRFLSDKQKDHVYICRKMLCGKLLALLIQLLYESRSEVDGQPISLSLQLLFSPFLQASSLYQNLGAAIVLNEWAACYKAAVNRGVLFDQAQLAAGLAEAYVKSPPRSFDELSSSVVQLTADCNEFVDYCAARGGEGCRAAIEEGEGAEDVSRRAFELASVAIINPQMRESLEGRYKILCEWIEFTRLAVRVNTARVFGFLASALFYFGCVGEKMTPLVRPLVEAMNIESNETVSAELFKGAIPLLAVFSQNRQPRPYVKVLSKTMELFGGCAARLPQPAEWAGPEGAERGGDTMILSMKDDGAAVSCWSRNAELCLTCFCLLPPELVPEYFALFDLDAHMDDQSFLVRLELHGAMWQRVGSRLSDKAASRVLSLLHCANPALRLAGAKAVATFGQSALADTLNRLHAPLMAALQNLDDANGRRGAVEAVLRLSRLGVSLVGSVCLLAPAMFARLSDPFEEVRLAAGEAFRNLVPLLSIEKADAPLLGLSPALTLLFHDNSQFIHVLSAPGRLPLVSESEIGELAGGYTLREYQKEGITWMRFLRRFGLNGILADDMGLGKTLQTLAAITMSIDEHASPARPCLVVCPRTLVDHWCGEWSRAFPSRRRALRGETATAHQMRKEKLVVCAYEHLKSNTAISGVSWSYVVCDEGHVLRNWKSGIWKAASQLRAESRLILSGTPVQNSPADVWSLLAWLMPGYLGDEKQFRQQVLRPLARCRAPKATEADMQDGQDALSRLHRLLLPFVLRRLKSDVLPELPEKHVQDWPCELSSEQRQLYAMMVDRCNPAPDRAADALSPLQLLHALRQLVDHPRMVDGVMEKMGLDRGRRQQLCGSSSGKMDALCELLHECGLGLPDSERDKEDEDVSLACASLPHRALIFCQWHGSVKLVSEALASGQFGAPVSHVVLDGSVPVHARQSLVDRFNRDSTIDVMVLTTHIGGVGLNLTGADVVIFMDHDWNPMKDLQAIDRAHRLGQKRRVNVYRLITRGTIEEKVMSLQKFKQNTADALIGSENASLQSMATDELMGLFTLEGEEKKEEGGGEPARKRRKMPKGVPGELNDSEWNLSELWDESQYDEQFDIHAFVKQAK